MYTAFAKIIKSPKAHRRQLIGNELVFDRIESATIRDSAKLGLMPTYGHLSRRTIDKKAGLGEQAHYFDKPGELNGANVLQMLIQLRPSRV